MTDGMARLEMLDRVVSPRLRQLGLTWDGGFKWMGETHAGIRPMVSYQLLGNGGYRGKGSSARPPRCLKPQNRAALKTRPSGRRYEVTSPPWRKRRPVTSPPWAAKPTRRAWNPA